MKLSENPKAGKPQRGIRTHLVKLANVLGALRPKPSDRILQVGSGMHLAHLEKQGFDPVGMDFSLGIVNVANPYGGRR